MGSPIKGSWEANRELIASRIEENHRLALGLQRSWREVLDLHHTSAQETRDALAAMKLDLVEMQRCTNDTQAARISTAVEPVVKAVQALQKDFQLEVANIKLEIALLKQRGGWKAALVGALATAVPAGVVALYYALSHTGVH